MGINSISKKLLSFVKANWLLLSLYVIIFIVIFCVVTAVVDNAVNSSKKELEERIENLYGSEKGYCCHSDATYTIVAYKKVEMPDIENEDSSIHEQMYGKYENFYVATNKPWDIIQYIYKDGRLKQYCINPCAVCTNDESPAFDFKNLYNEIISDYNVTTDDFKPDNLKSDFHYLEKIAFESDPDTVWYNYHNVHLIYYSSKLFFTKQCKAVYLVREDSYKVQLYGYTGLTLLVLLETLLFAAFWYIRKRIRQRSSSSIKVLLIDKVSLFINNKRKPAAGSLSENSITDAEYNFLLQKINPANFMNPYDAEKVKVANDLYSALLKSRDNETIIHLIKEKAKAELDINI